MLKIEKTETYCWEAAIRGMRNPMNSWDRSDTVMKNMVLKANEIAPGMTAYQWTPCMPFPVIGPNDYERMKQLRLAGDEHAKLFRMIIVTCDTTAPLYWWKEFDTYKVGTVANSCSTMHKIQAKEFTLEDFSCERLMNVPGEGVLPPLAVLKTTIDTLNAYRKLYLGTLSPDGSIGIPENRKDIWWQMIQLLPSSYNQTRNVMMNYEVLANIYKSRKDHKLDEWRNFCKWIEELPYSELITGGKR